MNKSHTRYSDLFLPPPREQQLITWTVKTVEINQVEATIDEEWKDRSEEREGEAVQLSFSKKLRA